MGPEGPHGRQEKSRFEAFFGKPVPHGMSEARLSGGIFPENDHRTTRSFRRRLFPLFELEEISPVEISEGKLSSLQDRRDPDFQGLPDDPLREGEKLLVSDLSVRFLHGVFSVF